MALGVSPNSVTFNAVNQSTKKQSIRLRRYVSSSAGDEIRSYVGYSLTDTTPTLNLDADIYNASFPYTLWTNYDVSLDCDETVYWGAKGERYTYLPSTLAETKSGYASPFLTWAIDPTVGTPTLGTATSSSIVVTTGSVWTPGTSETTVTVSVQYKATSSGTWLTWGSTSGSGTGYTSRAITQTTITGLSAATSYDFRLRVDRTNTANTTKYYYGSSASKSTIEDTPSVTTNAASAISNNSATLSATVDHNTVDGNLSWRYHTANPGTPDDTTGTEKSETNNPITSDGTHSESITGLSASTTYYFWAIYEDTATADKYYGSILSFSTTADPLADAADEDLMITQYVDGQYGVATTVYFTLRQPAATSSDAFYTGSAPVQADVKITKDGTYDNTSDNAPAQVDAVNSPQLYSLQLSATEMQADVINVMIVDAAGSAFRDHHIQVRTQMNLGTVVVNAANKGTNTNAITVTGNGTGCGATFVGGDNDGPGIRGILGDHVQSFGTLQSGSGTSCVLDASTANATNDYYNGAVILFHTGTGAGQARVITDYVGATTTCTLNKTLAAPLGSNTEYIIIPGPDVWQVSPGVELAAMPSATSNFADFIQFMFQRFAYKRKQTATTFTMRNAADDGDFASGGVDDDGTTQTHNALS